MARFIELQDRPKKKNPNRSIWPAFTINEQFKCSIEGCNYLRYKLYKHCKTHYRRKRCMGSPHAIRNIRKADYAYEMKLVEQVIRHNIGQQSTGQQSTGHEGIQPALKRIEVILSQACKGFCPNGCSRWANRLVEQNVRAKGSNLSF